MGASQFYDEKPEESDLEQDMKEDVRKISLEISGIRKSVSMSYPRPPPPPAVERCKFLFLVFGCRQHLSFRLVCSMLETLFDRLLGWLSMGVSAEWGELVN